MRQSLGGEVRAKFVWKTLLSPVHHSKAVFNSGAGFANRARTARRPFSQSSSRSEPGRGGAYLPNFVPYETKFGRRGSSEVCFEKVCRLRSATRRPSSAPEPASQFTPGNACRPARLFLHFVVKD